VLRELKRGKNTITVRAVRLIRDLGQGDASKDRESGDELHDDRWIS
jgi:hypothetical protein